MPTEKAREKVRRLKEKTQVRARELKTRLEVPNNNLFVIALLAWIVFLLDEVTLRIYDLYRDAPWVDKPSHFFAGAALSMLFLWLTSLTSLKRKQSVAMLLVIVAGFSWEVLEKLQEAIFWNPPYLRDYFFWDGFFDVLTGVAGALAALLLFRRVAKHGNRFISHIDV